jgi:peptidoglycan/LPS O-acetylase OafA/YrhL
MDAASQIMQRISLCAAPGALQRVKVLDGWRTVSITLVISSHLILWSNLSIKNYTGFAAKTILIPLVEGLGYAGVEIFFFISGFVICRGLIYESESYHRISLSAFYVRRALRIIPPLAIYALTIFMLSRFHAAGDEAGSIFRTLTFTCNIPVGSCGGWYGAHTWSLSTEEQFYLLIPIVFSALPVHRTTVLTTFAVVLAGLLLFLRAAGAEVAALVLARFFSISAGVVCALNERRLRKLASAMPDWGFYAAILGFFVLARALNTQIALVAQLALAIVIACLLLASMTKLPFGAKWLAAPPVLAFGRASYGIYLWQQLATTPFPHAGIAFYTLSIGATLVLAFASYFYLERPLIHFGVPISNRLQRAGAEPGTAKEYVQ